MSTLEDRAAGTEEANGDSETCSRASFHRTIGTVFHHIVGPYSEALYIFYKPANNGVYLSFLRESAAGVLKALKDDEYTVYRMPRRHTAEVKIKKVSRRQLTFTVIQRPPTVINPDPDPGSDARSALHTARQMDEEMECHHFDCDEPTECNPETEEPACSGPMMITTECVPRYKDKHDDEAAKEVKRNLK